MARLSKPSATRGAISLAVLVMLAAGFAACYKWTPLPPYFSYVLDAGAFDAGPVPGW